MSQYLDLLKRLKARQDELKAARVKVKDPSEIKVVKVRSPTEFDAVDLQPVIDHLENLERATAGMIIADPHLVDGGVFMYEGSPCAFMINPPRYPFHKVMSDWYAEHYAIERDKIRYAYAPWIPSPSFEDVHDFYTKKHAKKAVV